MLLRHLTMKKLLPVYLNKYQNNKNDINNNYDNYNLDSE